MIENLEAEVISKIDVVQRNGKAYMIMSDASVTTHTAYFKIDFKYQNVNSAISSMVSGLANSNWKIIKALMDPNLNKFFGDIIQKSVIQPIFNENSILDIANELFYVNGTCESF